MGIRETGFYLPDGDEPERLSGFLTGDAKRDARNVGILLRTIAALNRNLELDSLLVNVVDLTLEMTGAETGILLLHEGGRLRVHMARDSSRRTLPPSHRFSHSVPAQVAREGRPYFRREDASPSQSMIDFKLLTVMCVPLRVKDRILGVLYLDSHDATRDFGERDMILLSALAYHVAITLDNARLLQHYVEKQRLEEGLLVARDIQRRLLPRSDPEVPGFDIHGLSLACDEVSGDYFDYVPMGGGRVGLVVGDVAGHGIGAALIMATARALLRAFLRPGADPAAAVGELNDSLGGDMEGGRFMTLFLGALDVPRRRLSCIRAGHNPALLFRRGSDAFEELEGPGVALGFMKGYGYGESAPVEIGPGDVLFLFTDGIVETRGLDGEQFGTDRAAEIILRNRDRSSSEICEALLEAVDAFRGDGPLMDDLTMIVARGL